MKLTTWIRALLVAGVVLLLPGVAHAGWQEVVQTTDPMVFYGAVAGLTWLLIWAWRRFLPNAWVFVTKKSPNLQQMPAFVLAGLMSAAPAIGVKSIWQVVQQVVIGSVASGLTSIGVHTFAKEATFLPYQGGKPPAVAPPSPPDAQR